jgi:hypothetical protein
VETTVEHSDGRVEKNTKSIEGSRTKAIESGNSKEIAKGTTKSRFGLLR